MFPFAKIIQTDIKDSQSSRKNRLSGALISLSRLPKIYRLMKLTKLLRMFGVVKKHNVSQLTRKVLDKFRVNIHLERLIYYICGLLLFIHIASCIFYLIAKLENFHHNTWVTRLGYIDSTEFELYIISFYWCLTTVTTVGYGDIYANTIYERVYSLFIMSFGVVMYSFAISFISTVVATIDQKNSEMNEKLQALYEIKQEYGIENETYEKVRKLIRYDLTKSHSQKNNFLNELPNKLKVELSRIIHDNIIKKIIFFQDNPDLVNFVAPFLKQMKYTMNENIYKIGDIPEESKYILLKILLFIYSVFYHKRNSSILFGK